LQQHLNDIQLYYLQDPYCTGILWRKLCREKIIKHDKVRELFCTFGSKSAYCYALEVDKCPKEATRSAAYKDKFWKDLYIEKFGE
jgi:hypothetical protein